MLFFQLACASIRASMHTNEPITYYMSAGAHILALKLWQTCFQKTEQMPPSSCYFLSLLGPINVEGCYK